MYGVVSLSVRIMGKRQIGELEPSELVVTIMISEVASLPIDGKQETLMPAIIAILTLVIIEVFVSYLAYKSRRMRQFLYGTPSVFYEKGKINKRERAILITSLLYAMDKIAVTCGHYDAYRKGAEFDSSLELYVPLAEVNNNPNNQCYNEDANNLVKRIEADLVYIDPPYNSRQYCDAYHLLENVARWEKPEVFGVAKKMDRSGMKSKYCTTSATKAFETLINDIKAKYIMLSYNNMAEKGNCRSNAKITDEDIMRILSKKGTVKVFEESYKAFTTGKSDISENAERLFLCTCFEEE